jgi:exonuclease III
MDTQHNREWTVLCHNIRGINSDRKWNSIRNKIQEIGCDIICLQETKRENFDHAYLRNFTPRSFDNFCFVPSVGNSGGMMISWHGSKLQGQVIFENEYAQSVEFLSKLTGQKWILTNVYAPCTSQRKLDFLNWFKNISMPDDQPWIVIGDFNLIRRPENRNKPGGDPNMMMAFNEAISKLGILELPLSGQQYTWSNMQQNPLLERLD